jgi:hypothetical protein
MEEAQSQMSQQGDNDMQACIDACKKCIEICNECACM